MGVKRCIWMIWAMVCCCGPWAWAGGLVIHLPATRPAAGDPAPQAEARDTGLSVQGEATETQVRFEGLLPETPYDLRIALKDGMILRGVDLGWPGEEPADPAAEPLSDDDRAEITAIVRDIKAFENRREVLGLAGTHERAVAVVQLIRDTPFHGAKGDEVLWRVEVQAFEFQAGGWARRAQGSRVIERERFGSAEAFRKATEPLRWLPVLGGIRLGREERREIVLSELPALPETKIQRKSHPFHPFPESPATVPSIPR